MTLGLLSLLRLITYILVLLYQKNNKIIFTLMSILIFFEGCAWLSAGLLPLLESSFTPNPAIKWRQHRNAIVLLGSGTVLHNHQAWPGILAYSRINKTAQLYFSCRHDHVGNNCTILISGGDPEHHGVSEAEVYKNSLQSLRVPSQHILLEYTSRNTWQNAQFSSPLLKEHLFDQILLVTSSVHLKRSLLYFSAFGIHAIPVPSDYFPHHFSLFANSYSYQWAITHIVLHEYYGILQFYYYRWIEILFSAHSSPSPLSKHAAKP